ncbi:MAG: hypothetical protein AAF328_01145 [Planctomycetota bacterium]
MIPFVAYDGPLTLEPPATQEAPQGGYADALAHGREHQPIAYVDRRESYLADRLVREIFQAPSQRLRNDIKRLAKLPTNWDGEGSKEPLPEALWLADVLIDAVSDDLPPSAAFYATFDGGLQLEWSSTDDRFVVELEAVNGDLVEALIFDRGSQQSYEASFRLQEFGALRDFLARMHGA